MKKVLITGGSGYIGSHTALLLIESGFEVVIFDNLSNSSKKSIDIVSNLTGKNVTFFEGDICNENSLLKVFNMHVFDSVIHFAGLKAVSESCSNPLQYYENNVYGTIQLIKVMDKFNVKKIVFSSSATVYGDSKDLPIKESSPTGKTTNPYGTSKLMIEKILGDLYISDSSWSITCLRYFNPVGAHASGLIGENPSGIPTNLMPIICQAANGKIDYLNIFGSDYNTEDGTAIRDYIHVVDLAIGHVKALKILSEEPGEWTLNLGTGSGCTVLNLVKIFERVTGKKIPLKLVDRRLGDVESSYADVEKAKELLNWKAEKTLEEMCEDAWRWESTNTNHYE